MVVIYLSHRPILKISVFIWGMLGKEPRASQILSMPSIIELHPQCFSKGKMTYIFLNMKEGEGRSVKCIIVLACRVTWVPCPFKIQALPSSNLPLPAKVSESPAFSPASSLSAHPSSGGAASASFPSPPSPLPPLSFSLSPSLPHLAN